MKRFIFAFVLSALSASAFATGKISSPVLKSGDTVAFVGDSITHGGHAVEHIMLYYITRYPDMRAKFLNLGIGGDSAGGLLRRMDSEILKSRPSVSFLMIGMNDCNRYLYAADSKLSSADREKRIAETDKRYAENLEKVVDALSKNSRTLVLFTPSIYDQTAKIKAPANVGVNGALKRYGEIGAKIAASRKNVIVADIWSALQGINEALQKSDPSATIIGSDRVHPSSAGGFAMAQKYLSDARESPVVSKVSVIAGENPQAALLENCDISELKSRDGGVSFKLLEFSLPVVLSKNADPAEARTDFQENFNREILKVKGLAKGSYEVRIDGACVGTYSASELGAGVNLSGNDKTPQYAQAEKVAKICSEIRGKYAAQRNLYYVEHFLLKGKISDFSDVQKCAAAAREILESGKAYGYGKFALEFYLKNKPREKQMLEEVFALQNDAYAAAETKTHFYEIIPLK